MLNFVICSTKLEILNMGTKIKKEGMCRYGGSPNDEVRITGRCLRMLLDSWAMIAKGRVVDKSEAFAPKYPQFVMRNSDLCSSCKSGEVTC